MTYTEFKVFATTHLQAWGMYSPEVVELLAMIAAHESGGCRVRRQIGGGPARGIFQIEIGPGKTHDEIWKNSDTIVARGKKLGFVKNESLLELDDTYSLFVARHYLAMDVKPIPKTIPEMAKYAKAYWNRTGAATAEKYLNDYNSWIAAKI